MAQPPFNPSKGVTVEVPYRSLVLRADPDFEYKNRHQLFYEFSNGRTFLEDENLHGAYASSGPISINLTGVGVVGDAGTVALPPLLLGGVSAAGSASQVVGVGTLPVAAALIGVGANGNAGLVTGQFPSVALGGVGASGNANLIIVQSSPSIQVLVSGVSGIGSASPITGKTILDNVAISGASARGVVGAIVIQPANTVPLTGLSATASAGSIKTTPWTPLALGAALWAWIDLRDTTVLTLSGSNIVGVADKSNNAHDLTNIGPVPYSPTGINGFGGANWTPGGGGSKLHTVGGIVLPQPCTIVTVFTLDNTTQPDFSELWDGDILASGGAAQRPFLSIQRPDVSGSASIWAGSAVVDINSGTPLTAGASYISVAILNGAASQHGFNGAIPTTLATNPGTAGIVNGLLLSGNFFGLTGSVVVIDGLLTPDDRQKLEGFLAWEFGLA